MGTKAARGSAKATLRHTHKGMRWSARACAARSTSNLGRFPQSHTDTMGVQDSGAGCQHPSGRLLARHSLLLVHEEIIQEHEEVVEVT